MGALSTVDGGSCHLGDAAKVPVVGGNSATTGLPAVGIEEVFGEMTPHNGCKPKSHCGTGLPEVTE